LGDIELQVDDQVAGEGMAQVVDAQARLVGWVEAGAVGGVAEAATQRWAVTQATSGMWVSRRRPSLRILGHSRPSVTLDTYTHLFNHANHADDIRHRMAQSSFGNLIRWRRPQRR
jgi:hypothetical protein